MAERDTADIWGALVMGLAVLFLAVDRVFIGGGDNSDFIFWLSLAVLACATAIEWRRKV